MKCPDCSTETRHSGTWETLVGYMSHTIDGVEHTHDDNCLKRCYACPGCGRSWIESLRRSCTVPGCSWMGKPDCFCHPGPKVNAWSDPAEHCLSREELGLA
jgi:hypothetical protein